MSEKRIFYVTSNRLTVYWAMENDVHQDISYSDDDQGRTLFAEYLKNYSDLRSDVLVDVIDEEFRIDTMPHVSGKDRTAVQQRKLKQLFHHTQYRGAEIQGRETTGRRDDKVLFTALTNPEPLELWLKIMVANKVPVAGIYSLPMLAPFFLKQLNITSDYSLLFIPQSGNMIRQIFLNRSAIKISRLLPFKNHDTDNFNQFINKEAVKNQRYLHRLRTISPGDTIHVHVLCDSGSANTLRATCPDSDSIRYNFISMEELRQQFNLKSELNLSQSEQLFIYLLSKHHPKINYANSTEKKYHLLNQTRRAMLVASVVMLFSFITIAGQTILNGLELKQKAIDLKQQTQITTEKYNIIVSKLPNTDISPRNMQNAVEIVDLLSRHKTDPQSMMASLSRGLSLFPNMQINEINWLSSNHPSEIESSPNDEFDQVAEPTTTYQNRYQIASIKGQLTFFRGNYQVAFRTIKKFVNTLRSDPIFIEVSAIKYPIDIDSNSTLSMTSGKNTNYRIAEFEIRAVLKVDNEKA